MYKHRHAYNHTRSSLLSVHSICHLFWFRPSGSDTIGIVVFFSVRVIVLLPFARFSNGTDACLLSLARQSFLDTLQECWFLLFVAGHDGLCFFLSEGARLLFPCSD